MSRGRRGRLDVVASSRLLRSVIEILYFADNSLGMSCFRIPSIENTAAIEPRNSRSRKTGVCNVM